MTQPWGGKIDFTFDPDSRVRSKSYENGTTTTVSYDAGGRLSELRHSFGGADFFREGFRYDLSGRLTELRDELDLTQSRTLLHDIGRRLVGVNIGLPVGDGGVPVPAEDYGYDLEDNRTASHLTSGYQYDANHRLLDTADHSYSYDANGNRTSRTDKSTGEVVTYNWDAQDQLVAVSSTLGWSAAYRYDAEQRRIGKTVTAADGTVTEQAYVYDGPNVLFVFTTRNGVTTARRWMNAYGLDKRYGFEDYASANPVPGTGMRYEVHTDYLGSIVAVVDPVTGAIVSRCDYDSFGRRSVVAGAVDPGYGFTGQQYDAETGLQYHRARYYDPAEGRFLSTDPLGFPDGPRNGYVYVANTPYQKIDPTGLSGAIPFGQKSENATSNDIYPSVIYGSAYRQLLGAFNSAFELLDRNFADSGGLPGVSLRWANYYAAKCMPIKKDEREKGPPRLDPLRDNHGGDLHKWFIYQRIQWLTANKGARLAKIGIRPESIRMNQAQLDVNDLKVSTCRPDIQYNWGGGAFHQLEEAIVTAGRARTFAKLVVMNQADPATGILVFGKRK